MGRIFETRKATMFKRYAKMAKAFTKLGREIVIAVKTGGPNPESNPRLRMIIQNAKAINNQVTGGGTNPRQAFNLSKVVYTK